MIRAYSEYYLGNARYSLSQFFDYLINDCGIETAWSVSLFINTGYAERFERGNPAILAGMSGIELAAAVLKKAYGDRPLPAPSYREGCTREYWAGWVLAEYQWYTGRRFRDLFDAVPLAEIITMYPVYHEMDISRFIDDLESRVTERAALRPVKLRQLRDRKKLSQADLAERAGVSLRAIQAYEQRKLDMGNAQGQTLYRLSRALDCSMEDLLDDPMGKQT